VRWPGLLALELPLHAGLRWREGEVQARSLRLPVLTRKATPSLPNGGKSIYTPFQLAVQALSALSPLKLSRVRGTCHDWSEVEEARL
jgi:hypothetical protein